MDSQFHHIGIPVDKSELSNKARFSPLFQMYSEEFTNNLGIRIEFHAFEQQSCLDDRIKNMPHIAFKVGNIEKALEDKEIVLPLYEPFKGYRCAMICLNGLLIELIDTNLSESKIWEDEATLKDGILYGHT